MPSSTTQRESVSDKLVTGLSKRGNPTSYWDFGALAGAGAILSTAEDLVKFAKANFNPNNEVLALQRQKTFTIDKDRQMALGWFILKWASVDHWYWHNGGTGGFRSSMALDAVDRKGVIVLSNISAGHSHAASIDRLSFGLLESLQQTGTEIQVNTCN
jgi:CubicO group peptidase (beta-lactamase class C family)